VEAKYYPSVVLIGVTEMTVREGLRYGSCMTPIPRNRTRVGLRKLAIMDKQVAAPVGLVSYMYPNHQVKL